MIDAEEIIIGEGTVIAPTAIIRGISGKAKRVVIGDQCYIGDSVQIICDDFSLGDYSKIQHHTNVHGHKPCHIGHNAWIGQYCIIDCIGGTTIGDNFSVGAHSQLWTHLKAGDTLEGSRFLSEKALTIGNDVWLMAHCILSPITAADKSMVMLGSVVMDDMAYNTIYSGSPAKPISENRRIASHFLEVKLETKYNKMVAYLAESKVDSSTIEIVRTKEEANFTNGKTYFVIADRKYIKTRSAAEVAFMKFLLPTKGKFTPY